MIQQKTEPPLANSRTYKIQFISNHPLINTNNNTTKNTMEIQHYGQFANRQQINNNFSQLDINPILNISPYTDEVKKKALAQCIKVFHQLQPSTSNFQRYQRILCNIWSKYQNFEFQLAALKELFKRIAIERNQQQKFINNEAMSRIHQYNSQPSTIKYKLYKTILLKDPSIEYVQKLSNKLKVLYSKGRKFFNTFQDHLNIDNCMERCQKLFEPFDFFQEKINKKKLAMKNLKFEELFALKKRFDMINPSIAFHYATHPIEKLHCQPKVLISFYTQNLLLRPNKQIIPFNKALLYCPLIINQEQNKLKVAPDYLEQLFQFSKQWQKKVLTIQVIVNGEIKVISYLAVEYKKSDIIQQMTLIRDKVYQFMILQFLKYIMQTNKSQLYFKASIPEVQIKISMRNIDTLNQFKQDKESQKNNKGNKSNIPEHTFELISTLLALLKNDKIQQLQNKQILKKIRFIIQEFLISKYSNSSSTIIMDAKPDFTKYFKKSPTGFNIPISTEEALRSVLLKDKNDNKQ